jgi:hypothetical protein
MIPRLMASIVSLTFVISALTALSLTARSTNPYTLLGLQHPDSKISIFSLFFLLF